MRFFQKLFLFFVFSNLFIAGCAVIMAWQTSQLLLHKPPHNNTLGFIFFGSLCSYSFHWMLTRETGTVSSRSAWFKRYKQVYYLLLFAGIAGTAFFGVSLIDHWPVLALTAFITFLYSAPKIPHRIFESLRKVAIGKTFFLAFVWMHVTTTLPLLIDQAKLTTPELLFAGARFFLIYAICILFDRRDRDYDLTLGIKSLITWLSEQNIRRLFYLSLILFALSTLCLLSFGFSTPIVICLLIPGIILSFLYTYAITTGNDIFYYFILDGFMALSAVLTLIPGLS